MFHIPAGRSSILPMFVLAACCHDVIAAEYTRLAKSEVTIAASAPAFPGGGYEATNLLKPTVPGQAPTEYASHSLGTKTFVDFDLGHAVPVAAFRHLQRSHSDTIAESKLVFSDTADFAKTITTVEVTHVDKPGATTFVSFPPVTARFVRWQVTSVKPGPQQLDNVGGQSIEFFVTEATDSVPDGIGISARVVPIIEKNAAGPMQLLNVTFDYPYAEPSRAVVRVSGQKARDIDLQFGTHTLDCQVPAGDSEQAIDIQVSIDKTTVTSKTITLPKPRELTVYILPHSHTDIGFTALQTDIEEKQVNNLLQGLSAARRTADYPAGARFVWNVEVLWAADLFLDRLPKQYRDEFFDAVKRGQVSLNGMYLNELTGVCRPEELMRLFRYATVLAEKTGVPVDSAMISDVPGYTWGTVTAMNAAGIRYFSVAPNYFDRIGTILVDWENKPFWWLGPDGKSKVLVWIPFWGYAMSHRYGKMSPQLVEDFCEGLLKRDYPYDIAHVRWAGHGDNGVPDPVICDFVKDWNATHVSPRFIISSTSEAFRAFEERYGDQLPQVRGDWTPYWEDGTGSSSAETAMNRASSERLAQAETLWAMLDPTRFPTEKFEQAWKNVLLYSEHTWGAYCAVSDPSNPLSVDQWNIKQSYATAANLQSRQLLHEAVQSGAGFVPQPIVAKAGEGATSSYVDLYNTTSWSRTEVVILPHEITQPGNFVTDDQGRPVPAQRLSTQELAIQVNDLAPLSGRRYTISRKGDAAVIDSHLKVDGALLTNKQLQVRIDPKTGGIIELRAQGIDANLADTNGGEALNDYLYLVGDDVSQVERNGPVRIRVRERGPLVASLLVESDAPGCHKLTREIRLTAGSDHVELINTVDKRRLEATSYHANEGKESVNFAFPLNVPEGEVRLDVPLGVIRPEQDQIPSACKNWLTIGRWADVSNADFGVTWVTLDAPLLQLGGLTARLLNSQTDPEVWRKEIEPTQKLYSWVMNNHWGTNYRAYQEGPVTFRFVLRPHQSRSSDAEASRFATGFSQPLVAMPGRGATPTVTSLLQVQPSTVIVVGLKPSDDGKAVIVRLLNSSNVTANTTLTWPQHTPTNVWISDTSERAKQQLVGDLQIPGWAVVTLRAE